LNNRTDLDTTQVSDNSRLFVCCASDKDGSTDIVRNIFSILKNGSLYIGGRITGQQDPSNLPDQIDISNAGILITSDGRLMMDFANIVGSNEKGLTEYIAEAITTNNDALKKIM
jgi:hypothetical protein